MDAHAIPHEFIFIDETGFNLAKGSFLRTCIYLCEPPFHRGPRLLYSTITPYPKPLTQGPYMNTMTVVQVLFLPVFLSISHITDHTCLVSQPKLAILIVRRNAEVLEQ